MRSQFEIEKNRKAFSYTATICGILLLLALFIRWTIPLPPVPVVQDLIEINLGNNAEGYGQVQPLIKGEMSDAAQSPQQQETKASPSHDEPAKDIDPDPNEDKDAAPVIKPNRPDPKALDLAKDPKSKPVKHNTPVAVMPTPKPQKAAATYQGPGHGKGNGATQDNYTYNQGNNPGGHGDAGVSTGSPNSYGTSPIGIAGGLQGRQIIVFPPFKDNFNENAKVFVAVTVDGSGNVTSASIVDRGTTTTNPTIRSIALQKAKLLKFNSGSEGQGTIRFIFKVQG